MALKAKTQTNSKFRTPMDLSAVAPLGGGKRGRRKAAATVAPAENISPEAAFPACDTPVAVADSDRQPETAPPAAPRQGVRPMAEVTFNFKGVNKRGNQAIYEGSTADGQRAKGTLRYYIPKGEQFYPQAIGPINDEFPLRAKARAELTPEERKAARANRPKPTLAEKAAKAEARAAKLRQQLEAAAQTEPAAATM